MDSIQNLFNYLEQNSDIKINNSTISGMRNLQYQIKRKQNASLKSTLASVNAKLDKVLTRKVSREISNYDEGGFSVSEIVSNTYDEDIMDNELTDEFD